MSEGWNQRDGKGDADRPRTRSGEFRPRLSMAPGGIGVTDWTEWDRQQGIKPETPEERAERQAAEAPERRAERSPQAERKAPREARETAGATQPGRGHNRYAGKPIWCTKAVNPRKPGSHGFRSLAIIMEQPGITYEQYIKAGGRLNDLTWDDEHGNVKFAAD